MTRSTVAQFIKCKYFCQMNILRYAVIEETKLYIKKIAVKAKLIISQNLLRNDESLQFMSIVHPTRQFRNHSTIAAA